MTTLARSSRTPSAPTTPPRSSGRSGSDRTGEPAVGPNGRLVALMPSEPGIPGKPTSPLEPTPPPEPTPSLIPAGLDAVLAFVRHGESQWVAEGRFQGRGDSPLSELGQRQGL